MITNLNDFPEIVLVGCIEYVAGLKGLKDRSLNTYETYIVEENMPLKEIGKYSFFTLFALHRSDLNNSKNNSKPSNHAEIIQPYGGYVKADNPLKAEVYYYRVKSVSKNNIRLELYQRTLKYYNGYPDRIITY